MELTESELREDGEDREDEVIADSLATPGDSSQRRRVVNGCYDNVGLTQPAVCSFLLSVRLLIFGLIHRSLV